MRERVACRAIFAPCCTARQVSSAQLAAINSGSEAARLVTSLLKVADGTTKGSISHSLLLATSCPFLIAIAWSPFLCPQSFSTGLQIFRANDTASFFAPISNFLGGTSNWLNTFSIGCPTLHFAQRRGKSASHQHIASELFRRVRHQDRIRRSA